jgi:hypothetical protein
VTFLLWDLNMLPSTLFSSILHLQTTHCKKSSGSRVDMNGYAILFHKTCVYPCTSLSLNCSTGEQCLWKRNRRSAHAKIIPFFRCYFHRTSRGTWTVCFSRVRTHVSYTYKKTSFCDLKRTILYLKKMDTAKQSWRKRDFTSVISSCLPTASN